MPLSLYSSQYLQATWTGKQGGEKEHVLNNTAKECGRLRRERSSKSKDKIRKPIAKLNLEANFSMMRSIFCASPGRRKLPRKCLQCTHSGKQRHSQYVCVCGVWCVRVCASHTHTHSLSLCMCLSRPLSASKSDLRQETKSRVVVKSVRSTYWCMAAMQTSSPSPRYSPICQQVDDGRDTGCT